MSLRNPNHRDIMIGVPLTIAVVVIIWAGFMVYFFPPYPGGYCPHMPIEWAMSEGCKTFK